MNSTSLFFELGQSSLKALNGEEGLELPLERLPNGQLTPDCRATLVAGLQKFLNRKSWQARLPAVCAINARGVSLRRLKLPAAAKEEMQRLLRLQIESEFPLTPEELAWGSQPVHGQDWPSAGSGANQELMVAAVKKEGLQEYAAILGECGITPVFTLAALMRGYVCPQPPGSYAILDIGRNHSELMVFDNGVPVTVRVLPWGGDNLTRSIQEKLGVGFDEAEKFKLRLDQEATPDGELGQAIQNGLGTALEALATALKGSGPGRRLFLTGRSTRHKDLAGRLGQRLGDGWQCERVELRPGTGRSAAILGAKRACEREGGAPPLVLQVEETVAQAKVARPAPWKWAAVAVVLLLGFLSVPYAEALLLKQRLARKLEGMKADTERLPVIDRELGFFEFLEKNRSPYSDALVVIANSAPPGTKLENLTMNRHGDLTLRGSMQNSAQVTDFRTKLIKSGFFANVAVEEQTPTPDRQKMNLRMSMQWKPASGRVGLKIEPSAASPGGPGGGMGGEMPPGMPPEMMSSMMNPGAAGPPVIQSPAAARRAPRQPSGNAPAPAPDGPQGIVLPPGVTLPPGFTLPTELIQQSGTPVNPQP